MSKGSMGAAGTEQFRIEEDSLGPVEVPRESYWGAHTERARKNFSISGRKVAVPLIRSLALVKLAACRTNAELGYLDLARACAIEAACREVHEGKWDDQFPLDALQGGAGTSTNMNVNEVVANRALELMGRERGDLEFLHPIEHVNLHQSTNDVYPTALRVAALEMLHGLSAEIALLQEDAQRKETDWASLVKIGRTEWVEAIPMTLGAEFGAFAEAFARDRWRVFKCQERIRVVNLGGTAVGTGLGAPREYIFRVTENLRSLTGLNLCRAENLVEATANQDALVEVGGILTAHSSNLAKISQDLRVLAAFGELGLPSAQVGSSIMPTKVNPVALEAVIQGSVFAQALNQTLAQGVQRGSLQICEFMPLVADSILVMLTVLTHCDTLLRGVIQGLAVGERIELGPPANAPTLVTALLPIIGYRKADALAGEYSRSGRGDLVSFLRERLDPSTVERLLSAESITALGGGA
jgi:aspartate ammonia-lyase